MSFSEILVPQRHDYAVHDSLMKLVSLLWNEHHHQMFLSNLAQWFFYGNLIGTCTVVTYFSTLFVFHLVEADFLFLATRCSCLPQFFLHYIACHFKLINLPSWRVYQGQNCKSSRVFFLSKYTRVFHKCFTTQECKYCQLRFSCAIRNETVTIRFSEKSPRCSPSEIPILVSFWEGGGLFDVRYLVSILGYIGYFWPHRIPLPSPNAVAAS